MNRRKFIETACTGSITGLALLNSNYARNKDIIIGHNSHRYKVDLNWGILSKSSTPVKDCHEMVQDSKGNMYLLTNHIQNNVIVYDTSGKLISTWGHKFPGAHGLSIHNENGEEFLYITDTELHQVFKTTTAGKIIKTYDCPLAADQYRNANEYLPTETTVASNGDLYIADGYGAQYISHYNAKGELINIFGGRGEGPEYLDNAHGICIDTRSKTEILLITDRMRNQLKRYSMDGKFLSVIDLPGCYICRPVIHGDNIYLATIWSGDGVSNSGFISILDKDNKLISAPGGSLPTYIRGKLQQMYQTLEIFTHPHDICVDKDENLYIPQWNAGQSYPIKLIRV